MRTIAAFDLDGTITKRDSYNDLALYSVGSVRFFLGFFLSLYSVFRYAQGRITNSQVKAVLYKQWFGSMSRSDFDLICRIYAHKRLPKIVKPEAIKRIRWHKAQGHTVVVVTASSSAWVKPWTDKNELTLIDNAWGKQKVAKLTKMFGEKNRYILYVYTDSHSDIPLLTLADYPFYRSFHKHNLPVVVTDGLWRKSLSAIRSLGKSGYSVKVMGDTYFTTGFWSRFTTKRIVAPTAQNNSVVYGQKLIQAIKNQEKKAIILPMEDASLIWCVQNMAALKKSTFSLLPNLKSLLIAEDKAKTVTLAQKIGLPVPATFYPKNAKDLESIIQSLRGHNYYIVKPVNSSGSAGLVYLTTSNKIDWQGHWRRYGKLIVQERIDEKGEAKGVSLLFDGEGDCKASFVHKRLQQYPNSGGPSTDRISIKDDQLVDMSIKLMKSLRWRGVAMVEWKVDPKSKLPMLMEINPRFWGSLELAIRSGVNFPDLYARAARGEVLPNPPDYKLGVRCRWVVPGDILRYMTQQSSQRESIAQFLRGLPSLAEEWDPRDVPGFIATLVCSAVLAVNPKYWRYVRRG